MVLEAIPEATEDAEAPSPAPSPHWRGSQGWPAQEAMVFRLAPVRSANKDGDDRNNNYSPRPSGRSASATSTLADESEDEDDDCCCCCCWFNRRGGRRSARVSPAGSAPQRAPRAAANGAHATNGGHGISGPAATPRGQARATLAPFEHFGDLLTLDSIDSNRCAARAVPGGGPGRTSTPASASRPQQGACRCAGGEGRGRGPRGLG